MISVVFGYFDKGKIVLYHFYCAMKYHQTALAITALVFFAATGCRHKEAKQLTNDKLLLKAREIVLAAGTCTLITLDSTGHPRARAMDAFVPDDDFTVWFGTNPRSRKVNQIIQDPRVTLYYFDKTSASYVMIIGRAAIINTVAAKKKHWKPEWKKFYPAYPQGYTLIKVTPERLELLSESRGITGDPDTWQPPAIIFGPDN